MSITYVTGDLLEADTEAQVNCVNCVGVMGGGIALQFRTKYPAMNDVYKRKCDDGDIEPGKMFIWLPHRNKRPVFIINFPTKRHWKNPSLLRDVSLGLDALAREIRARSIGSVALPKLGCGCGGLDWEHVRPLIEQKLGQLDCDVQIYLRESDSK